MEIGISLGCNCEAAVYGVNNNLRETRRNGYNTCVFDEMISNYEGIIECISNDFAGFCDVENLELIDVKTDYPLPPYWSYIINEKWIYNKKYRFLFNHESPGHANLYIRENWSSINHFIENDYKKFIERYQRRIQNFRDYINSGNFINFIINKFDSNTYELEKILYQKYPFLNFKINHIKVQSDTMYHQILKMMKFSRNEIIEIQRSSIIKYSQENKTELKKNTDNRIMNFYKYYFKTPSHTSPHLNVFRTYAQISSSILELFISPYNLGVLWSCILGFSETLGPKTYHGIYSVSLDHELKVIKDISKELQIEFKVFTEVKDDILIPEVNVTPGDMGELKSYSKTLEQSISISSKYDTLIINSWFTYYHVKYNLYKYSNFINKYIIICATNKFSDNDHELYTSGFLFKGDFSEFGVSNPKKSGLTLAISEFLTEHPSWSIIEQHRHNYGLTILKRMGDFII